ncbi:MAG TPA: hypothetical protein VGJ44_27250 [Kribbellaceae bacterium]
MRAWSGALAHDAARRRAAAGSSYDDVTPGQSGPMSGDTPGHKGPMSGW